jgi:hypothetical protein
MAISIKLGDMDMIKDDFTACIDPYVLPSYTP